MGAEVPQRYKAESIHEDDWSGGWIMEWDGNGEFGEASIKRLGLRVNLVIS